jgi:hypothetical protein
MWGGFEGRERLGEGRGQRHDKTIREWLKPTWKNTSSGIAVLKYCSVWPVIVTESRPNRQRP